MPPAARMTDMHTCPLATPGGTPHVGGPILSGAATVKIGGLPAARVLDLASCAGPPDLLSQGSGTVTIEGRPAVRLGDLTAHGGTVIGGLPTVLIGG